MRLGRLSIEDHERRFRPGNSQFPAPNLSINKTLLFAHVQTYLISRTGALVLPKTPTLGRGMM
jgi:hypothetical protein